MDLVMSIIIVSLNTPESVRRGKGLELRKQLNCAHGVADQGMVFHLNCCTLQTNAYD